MTVRRVLLTLSLLIGVAVVAFAALAWHRTLPTIQPIATGAFDPAQIRRGATLAAIGDCATCHTAPGAASLAGGQPFKTAFGTLYSTNITPDVETGIGAWSEQAFTRALREGIDRQGSHLYPAFPYDHYSRVSDEDSSALYAYIMTRPPSRHVTPTNQLHFPFNFRPLLAGWNLLFARHGPALPDAGHDAQWNRGAYLVEGLGHCQACHTPRNPFGAEQTSQPMAGAEIDGWRAYALDAQAPAPTLWNVDALSHYLRDGWHADHGSAQGPMRPVTDNLARVPEDDVRAMAVYLASTIAKAGSVTAATPHASADAARAGDDPGRTLYESACASCHEGGPGVPMAGMALAGSSALHDQRPKDLVLLMLQGIPAREGEQGPIMPSFGDMLTDTQVRALVDYVRTQVAAAPPWPDLDAAIRSARSSIDDASTSAAAKAAPEVTLNPSEATASAPHS